MDTVLDRLAKSLHFELKRGRWFSFDNPHEGMFSSAFRSSLPPNPPNPPNPLDSFSFWARLEKVVWFFAIFVAGPLIGCGVRRCERVGVGFG